jgi:mannose-6-phosphate isomerase-like protein (cupin superfamily)
MAIKNKIIINTVTGQQIKFLQTRKDTNGSLLEIESSYRGHSDEPAPHYHPNQDETFTMISGTLTVRLNGTLKVLKPGDSLSIPRNTIHSMWNNSDTTAVVNWKIEPALNTEYFFETATGLANDKKTNKSGMPNLLSPLY